MEVGKTADEKRNIITLLMSSEGQEAVKLAFDRAGIPIPLASDISQIKFDITYALLNANDAKNKTYSLMARIDGIEKQIENLQNTLDARLEALENKNMSIQTAIDDLNTSIGIESTTHSG